MSGNSVTIDVIAPDSTSKYFVSGFALSPTMGLGLIKQPLQFIVKQKFYLDVSLPYSVKRGEVLVVQAIVFNFHQNKLTTMVTLYSKRGQLEFEEKSSNDRMCSATCFFFFKGMASLSHQYIFLITVADIAELA